MQLFLWIATVIIGLAALEGFKLYRLLRARAIRVRIILGDGRSTTSLTTITREGDIRVDKKSYAYDKEGVTYEGMLKIPTLEYNAFSRKPVLRRTKSLMALDPNDLAPAAAYDGITSHAMRELLAAFSEVLSPTITFVITLLVIVIVGLGVWYAGDKDHTATQQAVTTIYELVKPTPTVSIVVPQGTPQ